MRAVWNGSGSVVRLLVTVPGVELDTRNISGRSVEEDRPFFLAPVKVFGPSAHACSLKM